MNKVVQPANLPGPIARFEKDFTEAVVLSGYGRSQFRTLKVLFKDFDRWLLAHEWQGGLLEKSDVDRFLADRIAAGCRTSISMRAMKPLLNYLHGKGIKLQDRGHIGAEQPLRIVDSFRLYLTGERGITSHTAEQYVSAIGLFLEMHSKCDDGDVEGLRGLTEADVISFVAMHCPAMSCAHASLLVTALRSLLRFLHLAGHIGSSMTASVPSVPGRRLTGLPRGIEPAALEKLLGSCDRKTRHGARNFVILKLLSRLGLRAGEVAKLQLDDINWRAGEIAIVRAKGNRTETLPLPADVGEALADYLSCWRPSSALGRTAFVRIQAPHGAMTPGAVTQIVGHAAKRCGLGQIHAHRLRHTAATNMLRNGASILEVGQVLRHRQMITTTIYAKADREALRSIARTWTGDIA